MTDSKHMEIPPVNHVHQVAPGIKRVDLDGAHCYVKDESVVYPVRVGLMGWTPEELELMASDYRALRERIRRTAESTEGPQ